MSVPEHHKEIANFLRSKIGEPAKITAYRDVNNKRPIPIGEFGKSKNKFYSTIGICDKSLQIPEGGFEFSACGKLKWLQNALASSIYWLEGRVVSEWPVVCEDVVKDNAKSKYRHMAFIPSTYILVLSTGQKIKWLLGVPITDNEIGIDLHNTMDKAIAIYPSWMFEEGV